MQTSASQRKAQKNMEQYKESDWIPVTITQ